MAETNDESPTDAKVEEEPQIAAGASPPPSKTPMYQAVNAARYQRQSLIKEIQVQTGNRVLCCVGGNAAPLTRDDAAGIVELLYNVVGERNNIDFLLHTVGGEIDAAEKIVSMIRARVGQGQLRVIIPDFAKSAGTLVALAADRIVMSDSSELGPIDPQCLRSDGDGNMRWISVMNYLTAYKELCDKLKADPSDVAAKIMLSKLDPTIIVAFEAACTRARTLAEKHLNRWMQKPNFTAIAAALMDTKRWATHGQMIGWQDAKEEGLVIEYLKPDNEEWRAYWRLYCFQRLAVKDREKLFESDYASLPME